MTESSRKAFILNSMTFLRHALSLLGVIQEEQEAGVAKEQAAGNWNNIYNKTAIKRFADPKEIADAVKFCINNAFVNGSIIEVSGSYCFK